MAVISTETMLGKHQADSPLSFLHEPHCSIVCAVEVLCRYISPSKALKIQFLVKIETMQGPTLLVFTQCTLAKYLSFYWTASVDFKNSYDEWCIVIQKAQDKARCLLKEYDQKFLPLKVLNSTLILIFTKKKMSAVTVTNIQ